MEIMPPLPPSAVCAFLHIFPVLLFNEKQRGFGGRVEETRLLRSLLSRN